MDGWTDGTVYNSHIAAVSIHCKEINTIFNQQTIHRKKAHVVLVHNTGAVCVCIHRLTVKRDLLFYVECGFFVLFRLNINNFHALL